MAGPRIETSTESDALPTVLRGLGVEEEETQTTIENRQSSIKDTGEIYINITSIKSHIKQDAVVLQSNTMFIGLL